MRYIILFFILLASSCTFNHPKISDIEKFRVRNPVSSVNIYNSDGDIDIEGWNEDFIEITSEKIIKSRISQDILLLKINIIYEKNTRGLFITAKKPKRVDGIIKLKVKMPAGLRRTNISSNNGNIKFNGCYGNMFIKNNTGNINGDHYGNLLNIVSEFSNIDLNLKNGAFSDIMIVNYSGNTTLNLLEANKTYLDIKSLDGIINLFVSKGIEYKAFLKTNIVPGVSSNLLKNYKNTKNYYSAKNGNKDNLVILVNSSKALINIK